jgi:mannose-1-phosphate guanylyltransferase/mannose-6-phosphate isomerase
MSEILPVVLSGGSGTRLWPLSRESYPKQFHRFFGSHTLFSGTVMRGAQVATDNRVAVICNDAHRFMAAEQAREVFSGKLLTVLEPVARNTAAAIAAIAHLVASSDPILVVLPSDHYLPDVDAFSECVSSAVVAAELGYLVTFGITPTSPETGYGYIEADITKVSPASFKVARFVEKPSLEVAKQLVATGHHTWNSGMFVMKASVFLNELQKHAPHIHQAACSAVLNAKSETDFIRLSKLDFERSPSISVDYAVFEKSDRVAIVPFSGVWSDLGSWNAVAVLAEQDSRSEWEEVDNRQSLQLHGYGNHIRSDKPVALVGVSDLVVVDTPDALLVAHRSRSQEVKDALSKLAVQRPQLAQTHRKVYRPWGWYDTLDSDGCYQVKCICVKPGQSLSLQSHNHRAEHWVVVKGEPTVTVGDTARNMRPGQHIFIPVKAVHRLENLTNEAVEIIEVQYGTYLGEDDIVRYQDVYGRT